MLLLILAACGGAPTQATRAPIPSTGGPPDPSLNPATPPAPPWQQAALDRDDVPAVFIEAWRKADNRGHCAVIAPASVGMTAAAPRRATFGGGWGVAYDLPDLRSAFGIAGTGVNAADPSYSEWPYSRRWSDGSSAGYGPEGGTGPNQLAYLRITGQGCLYNVWSRLGREHLEQLLDQLRFAEAG